MRQSQKTGQSDYRQTDSVEHERYDEVRSTSYGEQSDQDGVSTLFEKLLSRDNLNQAYLQVVRNKGAAGVDGMTCAQLLLYLKENREELINQLRNGTYTPSPVRRVEIPKPNGDKRKLGIPGIYNHLLQLEEKSSVQSFVTSVKSAINEAYQAIEQPVEGTIITVIRSWAEALDENEPLFSLEKRLPNALLKAKQALENTTNQLKILKKNQVVDAGAKGFYLFIEGFTEAFVTKKASIHLLGRV